MYLNRAFLPAMLKGRYIALHFFKCMKVQATLPSGLFREGFLISDSKVRIVKGVGVSNVLEGNTSFTINVCRHIAVCARRFSITLSS